MSTQIEVNHTYNFTQSDLVDLPEGYTADDIKYQHIKWGTLYITFEDGTEFQHSGDPEISSDCIDWKRPSCVSIHKIDAEGNTDYANDYGD